MKRISKFVLATMVVAGATGCECVSTEDPKAPIKYARLYVQYADGHIELSRVENIDKDGQYNGQ